MKDRQDNRRFLTHIRLAGDLSPAALKNIVSVPALRVLQLFIKKKIEADARKLLPGRALDELTVDGLDDLVAMLDAITKADTVPPLVRLSGNVKKGANLPAAIARWQKTVRGSTLKIQAYPIDHNEAVAATGIEGFVSPFHCGDITADEKALIEPLNPRHEPISQNF